jgi:hypothetical protein
MVIHLFKKDICCEFRETVNLQPHPSTSTFRRSLQPSPAILRLNTTNQPPFTSPHVRLATQNAGLYVFNNILAGFDMYPVSMAPTSLFSITNPMCVTSATTSS